MENRLPLPRPLLPPITTKIAAAVLAAALVVSGVAVYRYRAAANAAAGTFTTAPVQRGTITDAVTGTGPIAASQAVPLNFKNSGKVSEIDVNVGDKVKAGQVLAKLDDSDLKSQLDQAKANLANAQAAYNKLTQGATPQAVASAQAAVDSANTTLANAQKSLGSAQQVAAKDLAAGSTGRIGHRAQPGNIGGEGGHGDAAFRGPDQLGNAFGDFGLRGRAPFPHRVG